MKNKNKHIIDLDGPLGNAYYLMGYMSSTLFREGKSDSVISVLVEEATRYDYLNLLAVFNREMYSYVVLETSNPEIMAKLSIEGELGLDK